MRTYHGQRLDQLPSFIPGIGPPMWSWWSVGEKLCNRISLVTCFKEGPEKCISRWEDFVLQNHIATVILDYNHIQ